MIVQCQDYLRKKAHLPNLTYPPTTIYSPLLKMADRLLFGSFKFPILAKSLEPFSLKSRMSPFFGTFHHKSLQNSNSRFFLKNPKSSLFYIYQTLTLCKKSEKSLERFSQTFCRTDYRTHAQTTFSLWGSTEVENWSGEQHSHFEAPL